MSRKQIVAMPLIMIASCGLSPMMSGKTNVAPNIATTCWAPSPTVRPQLSRSSGLTTSPGARVLPSPCSFQPNAMRASWGQRNYAALYIGGMGSREQNFYNDLAVRMGYAQEAADVQRRYLSRDYAGAAAAVPAQFVDSTSLLGPPKRIVERLSDFAEAGVTTLAVTAFGATLDERVAALKTAATALDGAGLAE